MFSSHASTVHLNIKYICISYSITTDDHLKCYIVINDDNVIKVNYNIK